MEGTDIIMAMIKRDVMKKDNVHRVSRGRFHT